MTPFLMPNVASMFVATFCFATVFTMYTKGILLPFLVRMSFASVLMGIVWLYAFYKTAYSSGIEYIVVIVGIFGLILGDMVAPYLGFSVLPFDISSNGVITAVQSTDWLVFLFLLVVGILAFISLFKKRSELLG